VILLGAFCRKPAFDFVLEALSSRQPMGSLWREKSNEIDSDQETFKMAINNNRYIKNEGWMNSILDFYKDTLFASHKREPLTRAKLLSII
jgi:hypothetical protein